MNPQVISVKEFISILNETLTFAYPAVTVEGEVSGFKVNQKKWVFFDLKDDEATLSCFMPLYHLKVPMEDGMRVRVTGGPKLTNWGKFSFTARMVELAGEGELKRAFELLRARLETEGLFAAERKRPLPVFPKTIGLVTSATSAAYHDFMKILDARWGGVNILLADVTVQGQAAPDQIVGAFNYLNQLPQPADLIVLIRGGGSLEDLQAFNTEIVARAVAGSRTPTIVGVGHEVDTSLADFAADQRAATPTDAARLAVPDRHQINQQVSHHQARLRSMIDRQLQVRSHHIRHHISLLEQGLVAPKVKLMRLEAILSRQFQRLESNLQSQRLAVVVAAKNLSAGQTARLVGSRQTVQSLARVLKGFDPQANLERGYAIVRRDNQVIKSPKQAPGGSRLMVQLAKGKLKTTVDHDQK